MGGVGLHGGLPSKLVAKTQMETLKPSEWGQAFEVYGDWCVQQRRQQRHTAQLETSHPLCATAPC